MRVFAAFVLSALAASPAVAQSYTSSASTGAATPYQIQRPPLDTPWTGEVGTNPWPEHPRPQLQREAWKNLNGIWTYQAAAAFAPEIPALPSTPLNQEVLIPSCIESGLSGIQDLNTTNMWFATTFTVPRDWRGQNLLLNFEAVDYEATVFINGQAAGFHRGGYFRFTIDATKYVNFNGTNELLVYVFDPTDSPGYVIPRGKQTRSPSHIFYRPCSGIWQTVWLEPVPAQHITRLDVAAGADGGVNVTVFGSTNQSVSVDFSITENGHVVAQETGQCGSSFSLKVDSPKLWSPDSPSLYNITVRLGDDEVSSYTGFRTITTGVIDGVRRPLLNGEFIFEFGTLDQGYWPDGIYTPPTLEAMEFDLHILKDLGMNMVRKHIKVEPDLFYHSCDKLGLLVIQDMPSMLLGSGEPNADQQNEWERQLGIMVNEHKSYTCIVTWVIYNEGWGQITSYYPEFQIADWIRAADPTRLIDATSGWYDHGAGDFSDNHHYATPQCGAPFYSIPSSPYDPNRIGFQGEFGGIGHNVSIEHLWNVQEAINTINQTYEISEDLAAYNYRARVLFNELEDQVKMYACSGAVWTQTTDVEGEVNGLVTYDRRLERVDRQQWKDDIQSLYDAAAGRGGAN
ncbi:hypothetical protein DIS24_g1767 [Lasiodiplodia hormozganensis]|uniref:Beta-galactosidase n=1 Tax=Lasiodiplodia hormozganensis TaxID=869390 RepID=A0AA39Z2E0_9PEZI|nr:hypothetical protein DIS24_g1767 [Lasiodiplodia hormozganensis]